MLWGGFTSFSELLLVAVGLSMDAFAVSMCKGLSMRSFSRANAAVIALFFGVFQALMPLAGWLLGRSFERFIRSYDHWIAFALLAVIGARMIADIHKDEGCPESCGALDLKELTVLAVATSIDALAVGVTFAFLDVDILPSAGVIGVAAFLLSYLGAAIGCRFGAKYKDAAQIAGGVALILIGLKILIEHLIEDGFAL